jgi:hypothetical protein
VSVPEAITVTPRAEREHGPRPITGAERWLPTLHTERGRWHFAALHSSTALAHRLGRTRESASKNPARVARNAVRDE